MSHSLGVHNLLFINPPSLPLTSHRQAYHPARAVVPHVCATPLAAAAATATAVLVVALTPAPALALGVHAGLLDLCNPPGPSCVSSQDDTPSSFLEPWQYDVTSTQTTLTVREKLLTLLLSESGARLITSTDDYLRVEIPITGVPFSSGTDVIELYFPNNDDIVHFRATPVPRAPDLLRNRGRLQRLRVRAALTAVPVLRGRAPILGVLESPFDRFAPTAPDTDAVIERSGVTARAARRGADADF